MGGSKTEDDLKRIEKSANKLQRSLDSLRVYLKYILFDLEATKREKEVLMKLLKEKNGER